MVPNKIQVFCILLHARGRTNIWPAGNKDISLYRPGVIFDSYGRRDFLSRENIIDSEKRLLA